MTTDTRQATSIFLTAAIAQAPGVAEMFLRLYPDQTELAAAYLAAVERMRRVVDGVDDLEFDEDGRRYGSGVRVAR